MPQMTDAEVIKALECCKSRECPECSRLHYAFPNEHECRFDLMEKVYDLINRLRNDAKKDNRIIELQDKKIAELEAQNNDLFYKLNGVMLSVDKWLEGKELKQDEVNRAITMREKTLQIVEKLEAEIERLHDELEFKCDDCKNIRLSREEYRKAISQAKSEAYREFAERLKTYLLLNLSERISVVTADDVDKLLKELTEKNDFKEESNP